MFFNGIQDNTLGWSWGTGSGYSTLDFSNGGGNFDWQSIIDQSFGIGSQIIAAWGHNPTQQVGAGGTPIGQGYSPASILNAQAQQQALINQQLAAANIRNGQGAGGVGLDDAATSITSFITRNPLLVAGGVLGLYLLMREPPRSRR